MLDKGLFLNAVNYGSRLRKKVVGGPKAVDIRQDSRVSRVWRGLGLFDRVSYRERGPAATGLGIRIVQGKKKKSNNIFNNTRDSNNGINTSVAPVAIVEHT